MCVCHWLRGGKYAAYVIVHDTSGKLTTGGKYIAGVNDTVGQQRQNKLACLHLV